MSAGWRVPGLVAVVGLVLLYTLWLRRYGLDLVDEGTLLAQFDRVRRGQVPYRDFETGYGPVTFLINATLLQLATADVVTVRVLLALVHAIGAGCLYWLTSAFVGPGFAILGLTVLWGFFRPVSPGVFATFNVPYPSWYAELFGYGAMLTLAARARPGNLRLAWVGALWGLVFLTKQNAGLFGLAGTAVYLALREPRAAGGGPVWGGLLGGAIIAGVAALSMQASMTAWEGLVLGGPVLVLAVAVVRARPGPALLERGLAVGAGAAVIVVPAMWLLVATVGWPLIQAEFFHVGSGAADAFRVPYPTPTALWSTVTSSTAGVTTLARVGADAAWLVLFPLFAAAAATRLLIGGTDRHRTWALFACMSPFLMLQVFPRADFWHLLPVAGPVLMLGVSSFSERWRAGGRPMWMVAGVFVVVLLRNVPTVPVLARAAMPPPSDAPTVPRASLRWDLMEPPHLTALPGATDELRGSTTLLGFPALGFFNFVLGAPSPIRHDYFFPGIPGEAESRELVAALTANPPESTVLAAARLAFFAESFREHEGVVAVLQRGREANVESLPYWIGRIPR